jgi:hypothetical protein
MFHFSSIKIHLSIHKGPVFDKVGTGSRLFPSVGLRTPHESIKANFGQDEFRFDINAYVCQERTRVWRTIQSLPITLKVDQLTNESGFTALEGRAYGSLKGRSLPPAPNTETVSRFNEIVLSYLNHYGYSQSYQALKKATSSSQPTSVPAIAPIVGEDMDLDTDAEESVAETLLQEQKEEEALYRRIKILNAVQAGDIDIALEETRLHYPSVLEVEDGLMKFRLRCRKLVELILESAELLKKIQGEKAVSNGHSTVDRSAADGVFDMEMEVDGVPVPVSGTLATNGHTNIADGGGDTDMEIYHQAFGKALAYGQDLQRDYKDDKRELVANLFKQSASLMAFADPVRADQDTAALVSHESRIELANELNKAILGE